MNLKKFAAILSSIVGGFVLLSSVIIAPIPYFRGEEVTALGISELIGYLACSLIVLYVLFETLRAAKSYFEGVPLKEAIVAPARRAGNWLLGTSIVFEVYFFVCLSVRCDTLAPVGFAGLLGSCGFELVCIFAGLIGMALAITLLYLAREKKESSPTEVAE